MVVVVGDDGRDGECPVVSVIFIKYSVTVVVVKRHGSGFFDEEGVREGSFGSGAQQSDSVDRGGAV